MSSSDSDFQDLPPFRHNSETEDESESESGRVVAMATRIQRDWVFKIKFTSLEEAKSYVKSDWIYKRTKDETLHYNCRRYKKWKCPAILKLVLSETSLEVSLFEDSCPHDHSKVPAQTINEQQKKVIEEAFKMGHQKPKSINHELRKRKLTEIKAATLTQHIKRLREIEFPRLNTYHDLRLWCESQVKFDSENFHLFPLDQVFILSSEINDVPAAGEVRILLSTKRLLMNGAESNLICTDSTFKLNWNKFPTLIVGTVDKNRSFHGFGAAVCKTQNSEDFKFIFEGIKIVMELIRGKTYRPTFLLADSAEEITRGYEMSFGSEPYNRINCWSHVNRNIDKKISDKKSSFVPNDQGGQEKKRIMLDIEKVHFSSSQEIFHASFALFKNKWNKYGGLIEYIESNYIERRCGWYEGLAPGLPSTNNALEAVNRTIKDTHTLRERLPFGQYMEKLVEVVKSWSLDRNPNDGNPEPKSFATLPSICIKLWDKAYKWQHEARVKVRRTDNRVIFHVRSQLNFKTPIEAGMIEEQLLLRKNLAWISFEHFVDKEFGIYTIQFEETDVHAAKCTCPGFSTHYICKHVLGIAIRMKWIEVPSEVASLPLGQKRGPGRPSKATKALVRD